MRIHDFIIRIMMGIMMISIVHQYIDTITILMHSLDFILGLKSIVFCKVYDKYHYLKRERFNTIFELLILPSRNKVVLNKVLQLWLQVFNKLITTSFLINQGEFLQSFFRLGHGCFHGKLSPFY